MAYYRPVEVSHSGTKGPPYARDDERHGRDHERPDSADPRTSSFLHMNADATALGCARFQGHE